MHIKSLLLIISITTVIALTHADSNDDDHIDFGKSFFNPRPQNFYTPRRISGIADYMYHCNDTGAVSIIAQAIGEYSRSSNAKGLGQYLFFTGNDAMIFGEDNGPGVDVFGQNFLLNNNFSGAVQAHPHVRNILVDFDAVLGLDVFTPGLYLEVHAPVGKTTWDVDLFQDILTSGSFVAAFALGNPFETPAPFNDIISAWDGQQVFFDVDQPLKFGRINGPHSKKGVADVEIIAGYTICCSDYDHFGINVRTIIPTGNTPRAIFLFEPIFGNGHHYALGAGCNGHLELWNCGDDQWLSGYLDANMYHLFNNRQKRTFDLKQNGPGSRYLLFKQFDGTTNTYAGHIIRGPNILTLDVSVKNDIMGELCLMLDYHYRGLTIDAGYNLWGRSRDKITLKGSIPAKTYGIAGNTGTNPAGNRNRTASMTTISGAHANDIDGGSGGSSANNVYIKTSDLDIDSAEHPGTLSHGFFAHFGYTWETCREIMPFVGLGTEVEFAGTDNAFLKTWHIWLKGGIFFF